MKKLGCLLIAVMLLLSGCGLSLPVGSSRTPDPDIVAYRDIRFFAQQMDEEAYLNMCAYYEAVLNFERRCDLPYPVDYKELEQLISLVRYECPELMMLDVSREFSYFITGDRVFSVEIPYCMTRQEYEEKLTKTEAVIRDLAQQGKGLSSSEKEKLVYDYIVTNSFYDDTAQWAGTAYGCLVEGKAKCDGISLAMKWAMEEMGVPCMVIAGDPPSGSVGHAWNVINIDGNWYDLDVTADVSKEPGGLVLYPAYNVSDGWIRDAYKLDDVYDGFSLPGTPDMSGSYHCLTGCYIPEGTDDRLEELYVKAYNNGESFVIQLESKQDFEQLEQQLADRLDRLGRLKGYSSWSWSVFSIPDYKTIHITAGKG